VDSGAKESGTDERLARALDRALELFVRTLVEARWNGRRREICRARELLCDDLVGDNEQSSSRPPTPWRAACSRW
jgi:hypothetical protein